jgi:hypothetical protein
MLYLIFRLRDEKRDKWWEDEVGKVTAKLKVSTGHS